jgi:hypothetical protein
MLNSSSHAPGDEQILPKKAEKGESVFLYIFLVLLFLLLLKAFKVIPDPPEYPTEILASIGAACGIVVSFGFLFNHMLSFEHRLTTVETDLNAIKAKLDIK